MKVFEIVRPRNSFDNMTPTEFDTVIDDLYNSIYNNTEHFTIPLYTITNPEIIAEIVSDVEFYLAELQPILPSNHYLLEQLLKLDNFLKS